MAPWALVRLFGRALLAEQGQWLLWIPVTLALGIGAYFALPLEPPLWLAGVLAAATLIISLAMMPRWIVGGRLVALVLLVPALGILAGTVRTQMMAAPMLAATYGPTVITGRVVALQKQEHNQRLHLADPWIAGVPSTDMPQRISVLLRPDDLLPPLGEKLRIWGRASGPGGPIEPGAFDFRRFSYFQGIGGSAVAYVKVERQGQATSAGGEEWHLRLERLRQSIAEKVGARLDGGAAGLTTALLNGDSSGIPDDDLVAMRVSGLQHLISISGLHVGLVAGLVFLLVRGGLALWPAVALRHPIKKYAAVMALGAAFFYMLMVGSPVPTQRSVLMTGIMLLAVLADRNPFSLRVIAGAAVAVLLVQPESLTGPSFQMSFAAVAALIMVYDALTPWLARRRREGGGGWLGKGLAYAGGLILTSLVASLATTPYAIYNFQTVANYGLLSNMIAVPLTSFWVMPWGLLACLLMPFGLEGWAISAMGWGVEGILWTARLVAGLPGATVTLPVMPLWGLVAFTLGGLWLGIWQGRVRWLGLFGILLMPISFFFYTSPDIRVDADAGVIGIRTADGGLLVSSRQRARFDSDEWAVRDGLTDPPRRWPKRGSPKDGLTCADSVCLYRTKGQVLALISDGEGGVTCPSVALDAVISLRQGLACPAPLMIERDVILQRGAHALWLSPSGITVETTRPHPGARPWQ
ncbi:ComEC/Rec2 family competence protein [Niveispirillum sp. SYP-B3756]|uniref:ComEC/Rec2 family competence protein n=1 Tax=Niveispirillum sp. SYP-B3756 TaxID=2662178 RepID=UPI001564735C|nr:ComEC/Rec2 family competence protein [Niveispirillum sp. SYP-B3756]